MTNELSFIEAEAERLSGRKCYAGVNDNNAILIGDVETGQIIGHARYENDSHQTLTIYVATHKLKKILARVAR